MKKVFLDELKKFLSEKISSAQAQLNQGVDDSRLRLFVSDNTENLWALEKITEPENAMILLDLEERQLKNDKVTSKRTYQLLIVDVPYQLPDQITIQGQDYTLTKLYSQYKGLDVGSVWSQHETRAEELFEQTVVTAKR